MKRALVNCTKIPNAPKKLHILRIKDNKTITIYGFKNASSLTGVPEGRIRYILNSNKEANGYKFYDC